MYDEIHGCRGFGAYQSSRAWTCAAFDASRTSNSRFLVSATSIKRTFGVPPEPSQQKQLPPTATVSFSLGRLSSLVHVVMVVVVYSGGRRKLQGLEETATQPKKDCNNQFPVTKVVRNLDVTDMAVSGKRQESKVRPASTWLLAPKSCNSEFRFHLHNQSHRYSDGDTGRSSRIDSALRDAISSRKELAERGHQRFRIQVDEWWAGGLVHGFIIFWIDTIGLC